MTKQLRFAFRLTHIANIPHIAKYGITSSHSPNKNDKYVSIGDSQIIGKRKDFLTNGINLSEYIPFYFGPRSPMLYAKTKLLGLGIPDYKIAVKPQYYF